MRAAGGQTSLIVQQPRTGVQTLIQRPGQQAQQVFYRTELLPSLMAEWLEPSPPNIRVDGSNPRCLKRDNRKGYVGGWIYPEYSVAWMIYVVGFDS